jgi:hypothetical protein
MKTEKPAKKGFIAILKEAFSKSAGCCGAGETCGTPSKEGGTAQNKEVQKVQEADKPVQK